MVASEKFIEAMRNVATPVSIVTTQGPTGLHGATVSAVCSLSADPPSLLICLNRASRILGFVEGNGVFCVNIVAEGQEDLAMAFSGAELPGVPRDFDTDDWEIPDGGGGPKLRNSAAGFHCRHLQTVSHGSHNILIGEVVGVWTGGAEPVGYHRGRFASIGRK